MRKLTLDQKATQLAEALEKMNCVDAVHRVVFGNGPGSYQWIMAVGSDEMAALYRTCIAAPHTDIPAVISLSSAILRTFEKAPEKSDDQSAIPSLSQTTLQELLRGITLLIVTKDWPTHTEWYSGLASSIGGEPYPMFSPEEWPHAVLSYQLFRSGRFVAH